jgi:hypothetical protein
MRPNLFCFYTKHPKHPECDWLCLVTDIKQALFYANHFGIPHSGVGTDGECFWIIEPTEGK